MRWPRSIKLLETEHITAFFQELIKRRIWNIAQLHELLGSLFSLFLSDLRNFFLKQRGENHRWSPWVLFIYVGLELLGHLISLRVVIIVANITSKYQWLCGNEWQLLNDRLLIDGKV